MMRNCDLQPRAWLSLVIRRLGAHALLYMSTMGKQSWRIEEVHNGGRLDRFLLNVLSSAFGGHVTRSDVDRLLGGGRVECDGRRERLGSRKLCAGMRVDVLAGQLLPTRTAGGDAASTHGWKPERVLFEDEWLIAVDKPAGIPTQPTLDAKRPSLFSVLQEFLGRRDGCAPYLGLHHRLDRDTSGVVLFTKDRRANAATADLFSSKTAQKTYQALAATGPGCAERWRIENYLGTVGRVGKVEKFGAVRSGGDPAQTSFRLIERFGEASLVEALPHTGRTHQIRVHLSECGHPIYGDVLYGGAACLVARTGVRMAVPRVLLHAVRLEFPHPMTGAAISVRCALPADFEECLRVLR